MIKFGELKCVLDECERYGVDYSWEVEIHSDEIVFSKGKQRVIVEIYIDSLSFPYSYNKYA